MLNHSLTFSVELPSLVLAQPIKIELQSIPANSLPVILQRRLDDHATSYLSALDGQYQEQC